MRRLLLSGFDPFGHYQINPSWQAVQALPDTIADFSLEKLLLPNIYGLAGRMLLERAREVKPDVVLMTGMDSGSSRVHIDLAALNVRDALVEDNLGHRPWNEPIDSSGPAAYFTTLPAHELVARLQQEGCRVHLGYAVGGYVCNDIFYLASRYFAGSATKVGFVHVPLLPEMVWDEELALPLEESAALLQRIIACLAELTQKDADKAE